MAKRQKNNPAGEPACVVVHPALKPYFTYRFYKLALRLRAEVNLALERVSLLGIQLGLLRVLEVDGVASQVALGRAMGIDKATMVKLLDDLEHKGLVKRVASPGDRRVKQIRITGKGERKLREGERIREAAEKRFFSVLSGPEREALDRTLSTILESGSASG